MSKVTFFKTQFPFNNVIETSPALFSEDAQKFVIVDFNIGACALYKKQLRPSVEQKLTANKKCIHCNNVMKWIQCAVTVEYYFSFIRSECTMNHKVNRVRIEHLHSSDVQKHLTNAQQKKVDQIILKNPAATPGGVIAEISMRSDEISEDVEDILNRERTKHELRAAKFRNGLALVKIEDEFPEYIISAELGCIEETARYTKEPANDGRAPDNNKKCTVDVEVDDTKSSTEDDFDLYFDQIDKNPDVELADDSDMQESLVVFEKHDEVILGALGGFIIDEDKEIEAILREIEEEDIWMNGTDILKMPRRIVTVSQYKQNAALFNLVSKQVNGGLVVKEGFLSAIAANRKNSCFIDATFELLWNAVLPFDSLEGLKYNRYNSILIDSYKKYTSTVEIMDEKKRVVREASAMIREFVWGIPSSITDVDSPP
ncbi:hypothetical protein INT47_009983 [Mucor saturninus]|uniref:Uncharacterized protein n=1 Tax=Mucor saturninus TaxID=64648 RepID=A0A8H7QVG9_9FUNG|nr:hypothetical protein INT47_009983 [Mucor saturninus]